MQWKNNMKVPRKRDASKESAKIQLWKAENFGRSKRCGKRLTHLELLGFKEANSLLTAI